jgi:octaprenyl-diphosphate synthase
LEPLIAQIEERLRAMTAGADALVLRYFAEMHQGQGKRLRPRLLVACAGLFNGAPAASLTNCAACCELLHTATLIHDDVIDEADTRRGLPTTNARYGNEIAVVVGDYLLALVFLSLNEEGDFNLSNMLLRTSQELGLGVIEEVLHRNDFALAPDKYFAMIYLKTGALFELCCRMGAYLGGADEQGQDLAARYGAELGLAFQVIDDLLDLTSDEAATGKPVFNDLREGRITLPLIHALASAPADTRRLAAGFQTDPLNGQAAPMLAHLRSLGSLHYAYDEALEHMTAARALRAELTAGTMNPAHALELEQIEERVLSVLPEYLRGSHGNKHANGHGSNGSGA